MITMAVFASNHKSQDAYMDVLVRLYDENVEIDFRSLGPSIDVMEEEEKELEINVRMLRAVVSIFFLVFSQYHSKIGVEFILFSRSRSERG